MWGKFGAKALWEAIFPKGGVVGGKKFFLQKFSPKVSPHKVGPPSFWCLRHWCSLGGT